MLGNDLERTGKVVVLVQGIENHPANETGVQVADRLRIETGLGRLHRDAQGFVHVRRVNRVADGKRDRGEYRENNMSHRQNYSSFSMSPASDSGSAFGAKRSTTVALAIDQELGEVPLDGLGPEQSRLFLLQVLVERRGIGAIDVDLRKQRECHAVVDLAKRLDLFCVAGFLCTELIAGKSKHLESPRVQFLMQRFETFVLRRKSAFAGRVDDQQHFVLVALEFLRVAVDVVHGEIVDLRHRCSHEKRVHDYARSSGAARAAGAHAGSLYAIDPASSEGTQEAAAP